jgi:hypothetical protein
MIIKINYESFCGLLVAYFFALTREFLCASKLIIMSILVLSTPFKNDPKWCSSLKDSGAVVAKLVFVEEDDDADELDDVAESKDVAFTVAAVESLAFICDVKFLLINNDTPLSSIVSDIDWLNVCLYKY